METRHEGAEAPFIPRPMFEQQRLSRRLYDALDQVGASENLREIHQRSASKIEIIRTIFEELTLRIKDKTNIYICGSRYEGSVTPDLVSDIDIIICFITPPIVLDPANIQHGISFLMIKDEWTYPGYVKLQWVVDGHPLTDGDRWRQGIRLFDVVGRQCCKHEEIQGIRMQGPAAMDIDEDGKHLIDNIIAFKCNAIPDFANAWITRQTNHNWPTQEQLETLSKMGCMVVGVGHWMSCEPDVEWRMSFSLQERVLISSLNQVQHKVYIVLKMIKKVILEKTIQGESLSSYHCKTCILYAVERTPAHIWTPNNMIKCILYCLRVLLWWIEDGFCPHYFIEEHNLFAKESFLRVKYTLQNALKQLIEMKHNISYLLETDCISNIMRREDGPLIKPFIDVSRCVYMINLKIQYIVFENELVSVDIYKDIPYILYELQSTDSIGGHSKYDTQTVVTYLQPRLHLHIAKYFTAQAIVTEDKHSADKLLRRADEHFCCTSGTDVTSVRFAQASILYTQGKYEECRRLLLEIERDLKDQRLFIHICPCKCYFRINVEIDLQIVDLIKNLSQLPWTSILKHYIVRCVVFTKSESRLAPIALQYEMYRSLDTEPRCKDEIKDVSFDFAAVDPHVYLCFLQYLVSEALYDDMDTQLALENIELEIEKCNVEYARTGKYRLCHKDTAYNLLTWIYLRKKNDAIAIRYFTESLKIRPDHNAARFLIRDMHIL